MFTLPAGFETALLGTKGAVACAQPCLPVGLSEVMDIQMGTEHVVALTTGGEARTL